MATGSQQGCVYLGLADEGKRIGSGGLYRRADGEEEWRSITNGLPQDPQVRALLVHPQNPEIIYAGTNRGPYRSDDRGDHWEALNVPGDGGDVWSLAFHPHDPNVMYAGYDPCAIHHSKDGGATWRKMNTEGVIFPRDTTNPPLGKRVIDIAADPSNPMDMYAAIEVGGLLASRDGGESWESIIDGLYVNMHTLDLHGVEVSAATPGTVYIITRTATFRSRDRGRHWEHVQMEEMFPGGAYCRDLLVAPDDPNTMYLTAGAGGGAAPAGTAPAGALFRSRDTGETWERLDIGETPPSRMANVVINRGAPSELHCGSREGQVFSSYDGGDTWSKSQLPVDVLGTRRVYSMACG